MVTKKIQYEFYKGLFLETKKHKTHQILSTKSSKSKHVIFLIFRNNLNRFWHFYRGTNMGAGSPNLLVPQGFQESEQVAYTILLYTISSQNKTFEVVPTRCSQSYF